MWHKIVLWPALVMSVAWTLAPPVSQNRALSPTPAVELVQDSCEPNDSPEQACELTLDRVSGPFTFLPAGDQDYYQINLSEQPTGQELQVSVRATSELDLRTTITPAGSASPIAILSSPAISTTLPVTLTGELLLRVENRAAAIPLGQSYTIELRRVLPPLPTPARDSGGVPLAATPDALENNWSPETAVPIAIGVVYDLTFACPVSWPGACPSGDHDYLRVPVKAGSRYQLAAFDLGPGVDPVIDLFWHDLQRPIASNDDAFPGGFASLVQWTAPENGDLIIRIGPRNGPTIPIVPHEARQNSTSAIPGAGGYRCAVALLPSQLASQVLQRVATAANVTLPTPRAESGSGTTLTSATPGMALVVATDGPTGQAYVSNPAGTSLRGAPDPQSTRIQALAVETQVTLMGQSSGAWVRVTPQDGVVPGWVYSPDLKRMRAAEPTPGVQIASPAPGQPGQLPPVQTPVAPQGVTGTPTEAGAAILVERLPPRPLLLAPTSAPRTSLTVQITIGASTPISSPRTPVSGGATPTPIPMRPLTGVRVQLITVFGDLLTEAVTASDGTVTLTRDLAVQQALRLRLPAAGLDLPLDPDQHSLVIALPQGGQK